MVVVDGRHDIVHLNAPAPGSVVLVVVRDLDLDLYIPATSAHRPGHIASMNIKIRLTAPRSLAAARLGRRLPLASKLDRPAFVPISQNRCSEPTLTPTDYSPELTLSSTCRRGFGTPLSSRPRPRRRPARTHRRGLLLGRCRGSPGVEIHLVRVDRFLFLLFLVVIGSIKLRGRSESSVRTCPTS
jgi:hypothetical protein